MPPPEEDSVYSRLKTLCQDNAQHFKRHRCQAGQKLYTSLVTIHNSMDPLVDLVQCISSKASDYDFSPQVLANGYRSYIFIVDKFANHTVKLCEQIASSRSSFFFRKASYARKLDSCSQVICSLLSLMSRLEILMGWSESGCLFPAEQQFRFEQLLSNDNTFINQYCFYGRYLGFQFCESMAIILKALSILMASFSEVYYGGSRLIDSLWNGSKYFIDPELRAKRLVNISQYASADFCKTFWFLGEMELMHRLPSFVSSSLVVNKLITIEPEPFSLASVREEGLIVDIPIPSAHRGHAPLVVRLLSSVRRFGMLNETEGKEGMKMASKGLIVHCHGGGFVAQSSRSHETYLRQWALEIDCPILSIDYSLAPDAPYPRALEEVFFAYCWAISNAHILGSTAERVILVGDSAGANLNIGLTLKCIEHGVRLPDGLFLAYAPVILTFVPSPSRMLCLMDPLLPFGFMINCSKAYGCSPEVYAQSTKHESKLRRNITKSVSPVKSETVKTETAERAQLNGNATEVTADDFTVDNEETPSRPVLLEAEEERSSGLFTRVANALSNKFANLSTTATTKSLTTAQETAQDDQLEEEMQAEAFLPCPLDMINFDVPHDPHISPYYIPNDILASFPPVTLLSLHLDPFLDDCVEFAKRLKSVGNDVHLEVLPGLSHGFLNFTMLSKEAHDGSKICIDWINRMLALEPFTVAVT